MDKKTQVYLIILLLGLSIPPVNIGFSLIEISPESPRRGDIISVKISGNPYENLTVTLSFNYELESKEGELYWNGAIDLPEKSDFEIRVTDSEYIIITVNTEGVQITNTATSANGVATTIQRDISPGTYNLTINGESTRETVQVLVNASSRITLDQNGEYNIEYDTSNIPAGRFTATINNEAKIIEILEKPPNTPPVAHFSAPTSIKVDTKVILNASTSSDDRSITQYIWWINSNVYYGESITWTPLDTGVYNITLKVMDDEEAFDITSREIQVTNPIPGKTIIILTLILISLYTALNTHKKKMH